MDIENKGININITITLIVPVYNVEKYLTQCLESIVAQTLLFDEVILINDGSTDNSRSICEKYLSKYDYFKLINQENRGLSVARNVGLANAVSEYVLFLDSDDYLRADTVKRLKDELRRYRYDAVYFDADIHCEKGYEVSENIYAHNLKDLTGIRLSGEGFFLKCYPQKYVVNVWLAIYRRKSIKAADVLFPEGLYYEDNYFTFGFMMQAKNVTYIPEKLYQRRYRENSITTSVYSEKKFIDGIKIVLLVWEAVRKQKDITLPRNRLFLKFVNDYCTYGLNHRRLCEKQGILLREDAQNEFSTMIKIYESMVERYQPNDEVDNLILLNGILRNLKEIVSYCPEDSARLEQYMRKTGEKQKQLYKRLLCNLPLNIEKYKVGIYGTGKHTEGLLAIYEALIEKITCNLVFIDSYKESGSYLGRDIIHYRQIDNSFNLIIISSFLYEQEMIENIRNANKEIPVYTFYDTLKEDVFSEVVNDGWEKLFGE